MSERAKVKPGDVVEVNLRFRVHRVTRFGRGTHGGPFTNLEYAASEPRPDGRESVFTVEIPDEFGRIVILAALATDADGGLGDE